MLEVLVQADPVRSNSVVVIHVGQQQMPQVPLAEHHDMTY